MWYFDYFYDSKSEINDNNKIMVYVFWKWQNSIVEFDIHGFPDVTEEVLSTAGGGSPDVVGDPIYWCAL